MPVFLRVIILLFHAVLTGVMIAWLFAVTWVAMIYSTVTMPPEEAVCAVAALLLVFLYAVIELMDRRHPRVTLARRWQWQE